MRSKPCPEVMFKYGEQGGPERHHQGSLMQLRQAGREEHGHL